MRGDTGTGRGARLRHVPIPEPGTAGRGIPDTGRATAHAAGTDSLRDAEDEHGLDTGDDLPGDDEHDPDMQDSILEGDGVDSLHDDGDPSEGPLPEGHWDMEGTSPGASQRARHAELVFLEDGAAITCLVHRVTAPRSKHVKERSDLLESLGRVLALEQAAYLRSEDPDDLQPLAQAMLATLAHQNKATTGRLLQDTWAELPSGRITKLQALLGDRDQLRARFIARHLRDNESLHRTEAGLMEARHVRSLDAIVAAVQARFGAADNSDSTVRRLMSVAGIPSDPRKRQQAYADGRDSWTYS